MGEILAALLALGLTITVEFCVLWLFQRRNGVQVLRAAVLINAFTQPLALYAVRQLGVGVLTVEAAVILVEGPLLAALLEMRLPRAYLLSVVANLASALLPLYFPV